MCIIVGGEEFTEGFKFQDRKIIYKPIHVVRDCFSLQAN